MPNYLFDHVLLSIAVQISAPEGKPNSFSVDVGHQTGDLEDFLNIVVCLGDLATNWEVGSTAFLVWAI